MWGRGDRQAAGEPDECRPEKVLCVRFSPDGKSFVTTGRDGPAKTSVGLAAGNEMTRLPRDRRLFIRVFAIAFVATIAAFAIVRFLSIK